MKLVGAKKARVPKVKVMCGACGPIVWLVVHHYLSNRKTITSNNAFFKILINFSLKFFKTFNIFKKIFKIFSKQIKIIFTLTKFYLLFHLKIKNSIKFIKIFYLFWNFLEFFLKCIKIFSNFLKKDLSFRIF